MQVTPGDLPGILDALQEEYELMGAAIIRTLTVEYEFPSTAEILKKARSIHRKRCVLVFKPFHPDRSSDSYKTVLTSFIAATEIL